MCFIQLSAQPKSKACLYFSEQKMVSRNLTYYTDLLSQISFFQHTFLEYLPYLTCYDTRNTSMKINQNLIPGLNKRRYSDKWGGDVGEERQSWTAMNHIHLLLLCIHNNIRTNLSQLNIYQNKAVVTDLLTIRQILNLKSCIVYSNSDILLF